MFGIARARAVVLFRGVSCFMAGFWPEMQVFATYQL